MGDVAVDGRRGGGQRHPRRGVTAPELAARDYPADVVGLVRGEAARREPKPGHAMSARQVRAQLVRGARGWRMVSWGLRIAREGDAPRIFER
jgi:hypothetical protein